MGLLDSLRHTFNINGAEISVLLADEVHSQYDVVAGEVIIRGRELKQEANSVILELKEFWTESQYNAATKTTTTVTKYRTHETIGLAGRVTVNNGSELRYPFETRLPLNSRITQSGMGWQIWVSLDIPRAVDPKGHVSLDVRPGEEFRPLVEACESVLKFNESQRHRRWNARTGVTSFRMLPPEVLKKELDFMQLELRQTDDGGVEGTVVFDLQEKSIGDYFKAIFNQDKVREPLQLSKEQLFLPDGEANLKAVAEVVGPLMVETISERMD